MNYTIEITESRAMKLFTEKFGNDIDSRIEKFKEECAELFEAYDEYKEDPTIKNTEHLKDEMSDAYCVLKHLAYCFGLIHEELLNMGVDKVTNRELNPNYKRYEK